MLHSQGHTSVSKNFKIWSYDWLHEFTVILFTNAETQNEERGFMLQLSSSIIKTVGVIAECQCFRYLTRNYTYVTHSS